MDAHRAQGEVLEQDMRNNSGVNVVSEGSITGAVQFVVVPGENIAKKIYEFIEQHDDQGMFVAEADGCVTTLTIPDLGISGGLVTLMGHFEIISLSGISVNKESCDGKIQRYTNLTVVALDRVNGLVGGSVNGPLIAASPVKITMGLFNQEINRGGNRDHSSGSGDATVMAESGNPGSHQTANT